MALYVNGKQISGGGGGGNTNSVELTYAEYQALTPEQQLDGTEYFITDINGDGQQFQPICYSEEEREIGVWIDGKPVYQKTVTGTFSNATYLNISVADLHVLAILEIEGILLASDSANIVNIGSDDDGAVRFSHTAITPGSTLEYITISKNNASSYGTASQVYATLRYTKTTDQAGSGTWTPQGIPAHHYSNDEQVVGTWVDGSTLYEKTIDYTVNKSASHTFDFTDGNAKRVVDGFIINSLNNICFPINCSWEGKTEEFLYDETHFYVKTSANLGDSNTLRIIVQYTKSST